MVKSLKIVVTGASGFIAKNLRKYLSEKNTELISISRNDFKNFKNEIKIILNNYEEQNILKKIQNS
jgi:NADH dehydrogenase